MSRLIDADRLIVTMAEEMYSDKTFDEIMEEQPTVKAIPLDKVEQIRAEIESRLYGVNIALDVLAKDHALIPKMEGAKITLEELLEIIDKALKEQNK